MTPRPGANFAGPLVYECHGKGSIDEVAAFLIGAGRAPEDCHLPLASLQRAQSQSCAVLFDLS